MYRIRQTFFVYLNEPSTGGETAFPRLKSELDGQAPLKVRPRLGNALLWPSVLSEQPMETDWRTDHEAMAVGDGATKVAVNLWIHQFDWKGLAERGCELARTSTFGRRPTAEHAELVRGLVPTFEQTVAAAHGLPVPPDDGSATERAKFKWAELVGAPAQAAAERIHADRPDVNVYFIEEGRPAPADTAADTVLIWVAMREGGTRGDMSTYRVAEPAPMVGAAGARHEDATNGPPSL